MTTTETPQAVKQAQLEAIAAILRSHGFNEASAYKRYRRKDRGSALVIGDISGVPATILLCSSQEEVVRNQPKAESLSLQTGTPTHAVVRRRYGHSTAESNVTISLDEYAKLLKLAHGTKPTKAS